MKKILCSFLGAGLMGTALLHAQSNPFSAEAKSSYEGIANNILKAAEKMPEDSYSFKATADVRTFGELIGHVANAQLAICGTAKGETKHGDAASKTSKADLVEALKTSNAYCDGVYGSMTDADGNATVKLFGRDRSKLGALNLNVAHDNEMYGTIAVYLRLKGIVPPSSEGKSMK
jgi:hypothetical protein